MREKITKRSIDALRQKAQAEGKSLYCFDSEMTGFGAVATKTGSCSYWIEYRLGGRGSPSRRVTIGKHGELTPGQIVFKLHSEGYKDQQNGVRSINNILRRLMKESVVGRRHSGRAYRYYVSQNIKSPVARDA